MKPVPSPRRLVGPAVVAAALLLVPLPDARGQGQGASRYDAIYGTPVDVSLEDLVFGGGSLYNNRAIRTKGRLSLGDTAVGRGRNYSLEDLGARVLLQPLTDVAGNFEGDAMRLMGHELEVTGVYQEIGDAVAGGTTGFRGVIQFWSYTDLSRDVVKGPLKAPEVSLEALLSSPGRRDGQLVRVVGKFRGRNLYGDLPARSQRTTADWVIKDDVYAVWVSGKRPKGPGWELDTGLKRDTGKWVAVIGRPETHGGVTYLKALQVSLTSPPTPTSQAQAPAPPPSKPKVPPVVVFALPLDGEEEVAQDSRFVVQFSKDMNEETFSGHVTLRYVGGLRAGDRDLDGLRLSYDRGRRALTVDPGDILRGGRQVELLLLPGIADIDGLALTPRPGKKVDGAVDALRYQIGG